MVFEALFENLDDDVVVSEAAREECTGCGQPPVPLGPRAVDRCCSNNRSRNLRESVLCLFAKVGIIGDLRGPVPGSVTETAFRVGLKLPGNATEQELLVQRSWGFSEHFTVFFL